MSDTTTSLQHCLTAARKMHKAANNCYYNELTGSYNQLSPYVLHKVGQGTDREGYAGAILNKPRRIYL